MKNRILEKILLFVLFSGVTSCGPSPIAQVTSIEATSSGQREIKLTVEPAAPIVETVEMIPTVTQTHEASATAILTKTLNSIPSSTPVPQIIPLETLDQQGYFQKGREIGFITGYPDFAR